MQVCDRIVGDDDELLLANKSDQRTKRNFRLRCSLTAIRDLSEGYRQAQRIAVMCRQCW